MLLDPDAVPASWRHRAVPVSLVLLSARDVHALGEAAPRPTLDAGESQLAGLLVAGASAGRMARVLGVSQRTVYRRLADLRRRMGVSSTKQLTRELAAAGMSADVTESPAYRTGDRL